MPPEASRVFIDGASGILLLSSLGIKDTTTNVAASATAEPERPAEPKSWWLRNLSATLAVTSTYVVASRTIRCDKPPDAIAISTSN